MRFSQEGNFNQKSRTSVERKGSMKSEHDSRRMSIEMKLMSAIKSPVVSGRSFSLGKRPESHREALDMLEEVLSDPAVAEGGVDQPKAFFRQILSFMTFKPKSKFSQMTESQKQERIDYLWMKVRLAVKSRKLWSQIRQDIQMKRYKNFDLDEDVSILVDTEDEVEFEHKYI